MGKSFYYDGSDAALAAKSQTFSTLITANPTSYGLVAAQATSYAALQLAYQNAYQAVTAEGQRSKSKVIAKNIARTNLRTLSGTLAKQIEANPIVTDVQKSDLGLSVRSTPAPKPAPSTPTDFEATLLPDGTLAMKWKCATRGGNTTYQVYRSFSGSTNYNIVGGSGQRSFTDTTIPAGVTQITYKIQAVRSTSISPWATFNVFFGTNAGGNNVADVQAVPVKIAA